MFTGTADGRSQLIRLRDLRSKALHLEGASAETGIAFTTRQDDAFVAARISLVFSYSNAVARDDGVLQVFLNNEPIGSVALSKAAGPKARAEFTFTPALLSTDNRLQFRFALKGQGAKACMLDRDRAVWVNIEPATFIYLSTTRLPVADDLASLPRPFADPKDPLPLNLPFVLPPDPEPGVLQAAGMVAGYFGADRRQQGRHRSPCSIPACRPATRSPWSWAAIIRRVLPPFPGEGPRVAVVANPSQVDSKLLLVIGDNAEQFQAAAGTLATSTSAPERRLVGREASRCRRRGGPTMRRNGSRATGRCGLANSRTAATINGRRLIDLAQSVLPHGA